MRNRPFACGLFTACSPFSPWGKYREKQSPLIFHPRCGGFNFPGMTYTVHVGGIGEVFRGSRHDLAGNAFNNYAAAGFAVILLRDGETLRAHARRC